MDEVAVLAFLGRRPDGDPYAGLLDGTAMVFAGGQTIARGQVGVIAPVDEGGLVCDGVALADATTLETVVEVGGGLWRVRAERIGDAATA